MHAIPRNTCMMNTGEYIFRRMHAPTNLRENHREEELRTSFHLCYRIYAYITFINSLQKLTLITKKKGIKKYD